MPQPSHDLLVRMLALSDQMVAAAEDLLNAAENEEQRAVGLVARESAKELRAGIEVSMEYLDKDG